MPDELMAALHTVELWQLSAIAVGRHILSCFSCCRGDGHYCCECDRLWAIEMENEAQVIGVLDVLRKIPNIDVDGIIGQFKFMGREA